MNETWKQMSCLKYPEFNYKYEVSDLGNVRIKETSYILVASYNNATHYLYVSLNIPGLHKAVAVHRLVGATFVKNPHPDEWNVLNHKDENKLNNRADNLEWCNQKYNVNYGTAIERGSYNMKHNDNDKKVPIVVTSDTGFYKEYRSLRHAQEDLGINRGTITARLQNPEAYTDEYNGYHFKYKDDNRSTTSTVFDTDPATHGINASNHKKSLEEAQEMVTKVRPNIIITGDYVDTHTPVEMHCTTCGNTWDTTTVNGITGKSSYNCPRCALKSRAEKRTYTGEQVQNLLDENPINSLTVGDDYAKASAKCTFTCSFCGKSFEAVPALILNEGVGNYCKKCNQSHSATVRNMRRYGHSEEEIKQALRDKGYKW